MSEIPKGRQMPDALCEEKAAEVVAMFRIWGISRADAYVMSRTMKYLCQTMNDKDWTNPLEGTGYKADPFIQPENIKLHRENFEFDS